MPIAWESLIVDKLITGIALLVGGYDMEMKAALTEMFRSRVRVAALDQGAHEALKTCIDQVYKLDSVIATAGIQLARERKQAIEALSLLYTEAESLYDSLLKTVENVLRKFAIHHGGPDAGESARAASSEVSTSQPVATSET